MTDHFPRITVVSAWYNRMEGLEASVASVLNQDGVAFEYIIVDDCSSDATSERLAAIRHPRLRVIRNGTNIGFTRSIARAVAEGQGTYIAVHGAGDISHPGRLAAQAAFLDGHSDHVAVGTGIENYSLVTGELNRVVMSPIASGHNIYSHGEVMYRRSDYEVVGGYRALFYYAQDADLWRRLGERGRLGRLDEVLYERRIFADGVHSNRRVEVMQAIFSNLGVWSAIERRRTGIDPVSRRNARAVLEQQPTSRFRARATYLAKDMMKAGRLKDTRAAFNCAPGGMMSGKLLALYALLSLIQRRAPEPMAPPMSLFSGDVAPGTVRFDPTGPAVEIAGGATPPPRITVVSAWYNRMEGLEASVASVLNQDGVAFEYIIVDDCSSDATSERLAAIRHPRLRVIRNGTNIGFTRSIARAVAEGQGTYIAVHDAGDISHPGRLAAQAAFLDGHSDHVAVGTGIENHDLTTGERYVVVAPSEFSGLNRYSHGEVMYRRSDYEAVGGYRALFYYAQDADLWWRLGERGRLGRLDEVLYERRIFADGVHSNRRVEVMQAIFSNLGVWSAIERRRTGIDPVSRRNARAVLEQQPTSRFRARATYPVKKLIKAGRLKEAATALDAVPLGMMTGKLLLLYCLLRVIFRRPTELAALPMSSFAEDVRADIDTLPWSRSRKAQYAKN